MRRRNGGTKIVSFAPCSSKSTYRLVLWQRSNAWHSDGSNVPSSNSSITHHVQCVERLQSTLEWHLLHLTKLPAVLPVLSFTNAHSATAELSNDSHDSATYGHCYSQDGVVAENGPIALVCCAVLWEVVSDGFGMLRIMCGRRCTRSSNGDGCTLMPARKRGITPDYTQKVSCLVDIALAIPD